MQPGRPAIRLIATDIDGTLVNDCGELTSATVQVLRAVQERGVPVVLVTGLNPWPVERYVRQIGQGIRAICLNGIFLLEDGRLSEGQFVAPEVAREAAQVAVDHGYVPLLFGEDRATRYLVPPTSEGAGEVALLIAERPYQPYLAVDTVDALLAVRPAQLSVCDTPSRAAALYPLLDEAVGANAYVVYQPGKRAWVEVNHPAVRKDTALLALAARLGCPAEAILYFGDSLNDLPVFRVLPHPVAVRNAHPDILALAWDIARGNNEEGVALYLSEFFGLE